MVLSNEQISLMKIDIDQMLTMLKKYDLSKTAKFQPILQIIANNIDECIKCEFDGIEELSKYIYEDWRTVCVGKNGIENWYLNTTDLELKGQLNKEFEKVAMDVEQIITTNYIIPKKWYSYDELINIGKNFKVRENEWNKIITNMRQEHRIYLSPMGYVPHDIWSFVKMLCLVDTEEALKEWFLEDIPAFGYLSPRQILQIENGADILRDFLYDIPI